MREKERESKMNECRKKLKKPNSCYDIFKKKAKKKKKSLRRYRNRLSRPKSRSADKVNLNNKSEVQTALPEIVS